MTDLVTLTDPRSPVAEAYRSLRTNLAFARPDERLTTLLVTSPAPDGPKSETLANLAVVTAQSGRKVTVVDCDLRRPVQHELFGLPNEGGVTTALVSDAALGEPPVQATAVDGLQVLTSGPTPPNPAELLGARRMVALIEHLAADSDLVLFDAPPAVVVTDAAVLAPQLDGVLLVLASGRTRRDHTIRARQLFEKVGGRLLGVVLTGVQPEAVYGYYGQEGTS